MLALADLLSTNTSARHQRIRRKGKQPVVLFPDGLVGPSAVRIPQARPGPAGSPLPGHRRHEPAAPLQRAHARAYQLQHLAGFDVIIMPGFGPRIMTTEG